MNAPHQATVTLGLAFDEGLERGSDLGRRTRAKRASTLGALLVQGRRLLGGGRRKSGGARQSQAAPPSKRGSATRSPPPVRAGSPSPVPREAQGREARGRAPDAYHKPSSRSTDPADQSYRACDGARRPGDSASLGEMSRDEPRRAEMSRDEPR